MNIAVAEILDQFYINDVAFLFTAADGQHIYMHALNVRCMVKQYGGLRNCPDTVTATLVEMEPVSMDEVQWTVPAIF